MTGSELKQRREALGFTNEDLANAFDITIDVIELWESFDHVPDGRIVKLALDHLDELADDREGDAAHDALMTRVQAALSGPKPEPVSAPDQALIIAAQNTVQVIDQSIAIMRHKGELPQTLKGLTNSREQLSRAIEGALGAANGT
jgi:transcriptional regulator with XRE-family HTH domain